MAQNIRVWGARPVVNIDAPAAAHNSGDLVFEDGKIGVAIETNVASGNASALPGNSTVYNTKNELMQYGVVDLPVPSAIAAGTKVYFLTASLTAGATVQAAPSRSANVASTLQTSSTSATLVGVARDAAAYYGQTTTYVAPIELAPNPLA